jgi:hypothetical protein
VINSLISRVYSTILYVSLEGSWTSCAAAMGETGMSKACDVIMASKAPATSRYLSTHHVTYIVIDMYAV